MPKPGQSSPTQPAREDHFLTAAEVATLLRTTPITVVRLCREGKLPATKPFGTWLISEADLKAHLDASRNSEQGAA